MPAKVFFFETNRGFLGWRVSGVPTTPEKTSTRPNVLRNQNTKLREQSMDWCRLESSAAPSLVDLGSRLAIF